MKKKQVVVIAVVLAVALLTGTAVYAIGNISPENNQVSNQFEPPSLSTAGTEKIEAVQTLTAAQVDISEFSVPLGTKAEQILRNTLVKKQMTEQEIANYNSTPDSIKQLTYEEARAKEKEYEAIWNSYQENFADKSWDERNELDPDRERFDALDSYYEYKYYADAIATGVELAKTMYDKLNWEIEDSLFDANRRLETKTEERSLRFAASKKALAEFYIVILEDIEEVLSSPNADGNKLVNDLTLMNEYKYQQFKANLEQISPDLMAEYTQRYESGESIESILG